MIEQVFETLNRPPDADVIYRVFIIQKKHPLDMEDRPTPDDGEQTEARDNTTGTGEAPRNEKHTTGAHTSVCISEGEGGVTEKNLPETPEDADIDPHPIVQRLRTHLIRIEDGEPISPSDGDGSEEDEIRKVMDKTNDRPYGAMDFRFIRVSKSEVELVDEWAPILAAHEGLRGMAQLVIHRQRDEGEGDKDYIPVPADSIRAAFGLTPQKSGEQTASRLLLWAYRAFVDPELEWSGYKDGRCRRIVNHSTPDSIMQEAQDFFLDRQGKPAVLFMEGDVSKPTEIEFRNDCFEKMNEKRRLAEDAEVTPPEESQRIIAYLNGLANDAESVPSDIFTSLSHHVQDGVDTLMDYAERGAEVYNKGIRQSITQLRRFEDMPFMLYQAGDFTPRPTPVGGNHLVGVDSKALPPMFGGHHVALDLSKAQLAMFARVAGGEYNQDMGTTEKALAQHMDESVDFDMWESMMDCMDLPTHEAAEYAVKRATYSAVYGASKNTIRHNASKEFAERSEHTYPDTEDVKGLFSHPVIENVLTAREHAQEQISYHDSERRHTADAFGRTLDRRTFRDGDSTDLADEQPAIDERSADGRIYKGSRSLLAYIVQSVEVKTMWPIFRKAIEERKRDGRDRWRVLLYKYDEVVLWVRDKREVGRWTEFVRDIVEAQAEELGITTELDVEYPPRLS